MKKKNKRFRRGAIAALTFTTALSAGGCSLFSGNTNTKPADSVPESAYSEISEESKVSFASELTSDTKESSAASTSKPESSQKESSVSAVSKTESSMPAEGSIFSRPVQEKSTPTESKESTEVESEYTYDPYDNSTAELYGPPEIFDSDPSFDPDSNFTEPLYGPPDFEESDDSSYDPDENFQSPLYGPPDCFESE